MPGCALNAEVREDGGMLGDLRRAPRVHLLAGLNGGRQDRRRLVFIGRLACSQLPQRFRQLAVGVVSRVLR